jgi:ABC-type transport system involved in multi-copper enzyme maturation permease subunit
VIGGPVFLREIIAHSRRPRTYVFQTIFLAVLVIAIIPLWPPSGQGQSGAKIAETGGLIFMYGAYMQVILLALLAPATTANAITLEKTKNSLDVLLLSSAGPFAIVSGKFFSRLFNLVFLLFLTMPLLFALLTLGGVSAGAILVEFTILVSFAVFGAGLGVFLSTVLPKTTSVLMVGYGIMALVISLPFLLDATGALTTPAGTHPLLAAYISPLYDMVYLFQTSSFVSTESFPSRWWVFPLWSTGVGLFLAAMAGLLLPRANAIERVLSLRKVLEGFDQLTERTLSFGRRAKAKQAGEERVPIGKGNPIYWKETSVNTIGRFKYWWRVNLLVLLLMGGSYLLFKPLLSSIDFHKVMVAVLAGLIVLLSTIIAATTVSQEREDGSLVLLATTPVECATYVKGKVRGIVRNISFLIALPFIHVALWTLLGVIHPASFFLLLLAIPVAAVAAVIQGIFVSLLFPTTLRAIIAAIVVLILESTLPAVCCLPTFNLPLACHFFVEPVGGLGSSFATASQGNYLTAMALAVVFSAGTQIGFVVVVYSLISSGFDRYIGRAA